MENDVQPFLGGESASLSHRMNMRCLQGEREVIGKGKKELAYARFLLYRPDARCDTARVRSAVSTWAAQNTCGSGDGLNVVL